MGWSYKRAMFQKLIYSQGQFNVRSESIVEVWPVSPFAKVRTIV